MEQINKANDQLQGFIGTEHWYKTILPGITYTDGVHELCERFKCWWFLDVVVSCQCEKKFKAEEFQTWELKRFEDDSWVVIATDGNKNVLTTQEGEYTDFEPRNAVVWLSHGVIMLPSEY